MRKEHPHQSWWPALLAAGAAWFGCAASAETVMTVTGPVVTTGDYIANGTGVLEKKWRYEITNTSAVGDVNNMIEFHIDSGTHNNIQKTYVQYGGDPGIISSYLTASISGFTGLLPPSSPLDLAESQINFFLITPATTPSAPGLATATAEGIGYNVPFPSVAVEVPAAEPTVDFFENDGVARYNQSTGKYVLDMTVINNMDTEPAGNPYNDYVSEIRVEGIYSATAPSFGNIPVQWNVGTIELLDEVKRIWRMTIGTTQASPRIAPGDSRDFIINITLPAGLSGSAIRYGAVSGWGKTFSHFDQPEGGDTFVGPVGVEYPVPVVGLTVAAGQVVLGMKGLVVGRQYRVMRSADLVGWQEADRFTVTEDPWPASGRVDREWSEAAVLPGRRFYRLEWTEP